MMSVLLIPIVAMMIPMIIVPTALALKHARFVREREHAERMKALELGLALPEDESWTPAGIAVAIGVGVPLGSLAIAWLAGQTSHVAAQPLAVSAGAIGLGGVICGTILALRHSSDRQRLASLYPPEEKLAYDPDTFDVVGSRG